MAKKKWVQSATEGAHGQFRRKAEAAGMSTGAFAAKEADAPGKLGKQARLAQALMGMHHGDEKPKHKARGDRMRALYRKG